MPFLIKLARVLDVVLIFPAPGRHGSKPPHNSDYVPANREILSSLLPVLRSCIFHRQPVAREAVRGILRHHRFQNFHSVGLMSLRATIPSDGVPVFFSSGATGDRYLGVPPRCHWATRTWANAGHEKQFSPVRRPRAKCATGAGQHWLRAVFPKLPADAIRFHVTQDSGELIHIQYVFEKECWPGEHGSFDYSVSQKLSSALVDETLCRQAQAFLESYLRRRSEA